MAPNFSMVLSDAQLEVPKIFLFTSEELQNGHAYIRRPDSPEKNYLYTQPAATNSHLVTKLQKCSSLITFSSIEPVVRECVDFAFNVHVTIDQVSLLYFSLFCSFVV